MKIQKEPKMLKGEQCELFNDLRKQHILSFMDGLISHLKDIEQLDWRIAGIIEELLPYLDEKDAQMLEGFIYTVLGVKPKALSYVCSLAKKFRDELHKLFDSQATTKEDKPKTFSPEEIEEIFNT